MNHCELTLEVLINRCHRNKLALFQTSAVSDLPSLLFSNANEERTAPPLILIFQGYNYIITVNQTNPLCHYNCARCLKLTANGLIFFSSSNMGREELKHTKSSSPLKCTESQDSDSSIWTLQEKKTQHGVKGRDRASHLTQSDCKAISEPLNPLLQQTSDPVPPLSQCPSL